MATSNTSKPAAHGRHMPSYLVRVARAQRSEVPQSHPGHRGSNEIDNHADTICARPNWRLLELSGKTGMSPHSPQIINQKLTSQLQSVQQGTHARPMATRLSLLLTKFCGLTTNSTARSLIHTKSVPTGTVFVITHGTPTGHLGSITTACLHRC